MKRCIELRPFEDTTQVVFVDWEFALNAAKSLDISAEEEGRLPINGKAAINILAEYGVITHKCVYLPENSKLAIVLSPPFVRFCPSVDGLEGIFIEEYEEGKHGKVFLELKKEGLFSYSNIDSRIDGWGFFGDMIALSWQVRNSIQQPE